MKQIRIKRADGKCDPAILVDESHAVYSDRERTGFVYLFTVKPLPEPDTYISAENFNHVIVGRSVRTERELIRIVEKLQSISAYELLTRFYDRSQVSFIVNKRAGR